MLTSGRKSMMQRTGAVVIFLVGAILITAGLSGTVSEGVGIGGLLAAAGVVLFVVSFIPQPIIAGDVPNQLSVFQRITGLFSQPARVFQDLRAHPNWLLPLAIIVFCSATYNFAYTLRLKPEVITAAVIDKALSAQPIPAAQRSEIKRRQIAAAKSPLSFVWLLLSMISGVFIFMVLLAAVMLLGVTLCGGHVNFWQALAIAFYAAVPPVIIQSGLSLLLLYLQSPEGINPIRGQRGLVRDSLNILFSPDSHPVLYTAASFIGFVSLYGLWLTAKGLRHASHASSSGVAWTTAFALWALTLGFNTVIAALYPRFV